MRIPEIASTPGAPAATWFERACGIIAFVLPFGVSLAHLASGPVWRDDSALLRGLAWVGNRPSGGVSALLVQASFFLPVGSIYFRVALGSALVLGAAGYAIFALAHRILRESADTPRLSPALASIAALTATLGVTGQREAAGQSGAAALVLAVLALLARTDRTLEEPRRAFLLGALAGALVGENGAVAVALAIGIVLAHAASRGAASRGALVSAGAGAALAALFVLAPSYIRPLAGRPFLDLGRSIASLGPSVFEGPVHPLGGTGALRDQVGVLALGVACAGGIIGLARSRLRGHAVLLVTVILLDLAASSHGGSLVSSEELAPLHLVALSFLAIAIAIALHSVAVTLLDMRLPMAREATLLLVMGDLAITAAAAEDASFVANRSSARGAEAFTDDAVERLAPGAALLVRSRQAAHRLWAARLVEGTRPDLLVVPVSILGDAKIALGLLRAEPALQQTLRDVSLEGRPGEEALTILADARPTLVELHPRWDRRIVSHLVADHFWLRFAPEPLGPSDRKSAFADLRLHFERVLAASTVDERIDPGTAAILRGRLTDGAAEAAMLGDRDEAISLVEQLGKVSSGDRFVAELTQRLAATKSGPVDVKGLLR